jgi:hypothetical protein
MTLAPKLASQRAHGAAPGQATVTDAVVVLLSIFGEGLRTGGTS